MTSSHTAADDRIFFKEACSLARAGAHVTLIHSDAHKAPADKRGVTFVSYEGGGSLKRRILTVDKLEEAIQSQPFDLIHCHEPDGLLAAIRVKENGGGKVVFDSHEMWSAVAAQRFPIGVRGAMMNSYQFLERRWIARCDAGIGASPSITDYLRPVLGQDRAETILNVPVASVFGEWSTRDWREGTTLCHDGFLTFDRGLRMMLEAIRIVSAKHRVVLKIVGDVFGEERLWLEEFISRFGLQEVVIRTGWLPYEQVGAALESCHLGLLAFSECPNHIIAAPNKIYNYLMYGIPFVGPRFVRILQGMAYDEGVCALADPRDPHSYADAICRLIEDRPGTLAMGARALEASRTKYRWQHMEPKLFALYERVLGG